MIDTERRWLMRRPGSELVVRNVVSWRIVAATTGGDEEAEIELVARAGGRLAKESVS